MASPSVSVGQQQRAVRRLVARVDDLGGGAAPRECPTRTRSRKPASAKTPPTNATRGGAPARDGARDELGEPVGAAIRDRPKRVEAQRRRSERCEAVARRSLLYRRRARARAATAAPKNSHAARVSQRAASPSSCARISSASASRAMRKRASLVAEEIAPAAERTRPAVVVAAVDDRTRSGDDDDARLGRRARRHARSAYRASAARASPTAAPASRP